MGEVYHTDAQRAFLGSVKGALSGPRQSAFQKLFEWGKNVILHFNTKSSPKSQPQTWTSTVANPFESGPGVGGNINADKLAAYRQGNRR